MNPRVTACERLRKLQSWAEADVVDEERLRIAFDERTKVIYGRYLSRMARMCQSGGRRLLDVGCSTGAFMECARAMGWSPQGIELGQASARYAGERVSVPIHRVSLFDFDPDGERFDAVSILEVIEHLDDPQEALRRAASWLRPGGVMLVSTPNFNSLYRRVHGVNWWVINCEDEHIVFFDCRTLRRAVESAQLQPKWFHNRGFDFTGFLKTFRNAAANSGGGAAPEGYFETRARKERLKSLLAQWGVLSVVRLGLEALDFGFSAHASPLYGLGEQLVMIAQKPRS